MIAFVWKPCRRQLPTVHGVQRWAIGESWEQVPVPVADRGDYRVERIARSFDRVTAPASRGVGKARPRLTAAELMAVKPKGYVHIIEAFSAPSGHIYARVHCTVPGCDTAPYALQAGDWSKRTPVTCASHRCRSYWKKTNGQKQIAKARAARPGSVRNGSPSQQSALSAPAAPDRGAYARRAEQGTLENSLAGERVGEDDHAGLPGAGQGADRADGSDGVDGPDHPTEPT